MTYDAVFLTFRRNILPPSSTLHRPQDQKEDISLQFGSSLAVADVYCCRRNCRHFKIKMFKVQAQMWLSETDTLCTGGNSERDTTDRMRTHGVEG
jgi:hypothetical protein